MCELRRFLNARRNDKKGKKYFLLLAHMVLKSQRGSPVGWSLNLSHLFEDSHGLTSVNGTFKTKLS